MTDEPPLSGRAMAIGLDVGGGAGAALFAATGNPVWIGVRAGMGAVVGAVIGGHGRR
jgi:hypothetical protein